MRDIYLPPIESLPLGAGIIVVIIVPTLAEGDEGEEQVVSAVVRGWKTPLPDEMGEGVDTEGAVVQKHSADEESPGQHLKPVGP